MARRGSIHCLLLAAVASLLLSGISLRAEDAPSPAARLRSSDAGSALDSAGLQPWHLTISVQLFDQKGKPSDSGTVEEWWSSTADRRTYTTTGYGATEIRRDGKLYRTAGAGSPPYYLDLLRKQVVHPLPASSEVDASRPELRKQNFGKLSLDCIMLDQQIDQLAFAPLGLFPTYCLEPGNNRLLVAFEFGGQLALRNLIGTFQGRSVATSITVRSNDVQAATAKVTSLAAEAIPEAQLATGELEEQPTEATIAVSPPTMAAAALSQPAPQYPASAKAGGITGSVLLDAVIGTDGHIHNLQVKESPDPALTVAAIAAVQRWVYKPYQVDGQPRDVDTTITVNFQMRDDTF